MGYEWFLAGRYLRGAHRGRVRISTAGVTIGVMVLVVVISVMNGFQRDFLGKMLGAFGHLRLYPLSAGDRLPTDFQDYETLVDEIESQPGVKAASPVIEQEGFMLVSAGTSNDPTSQGVMVRGIAPAHENQVGDFEDYLKIGDWAELEEKANAAKEASGTRTIDPFEEVEAEVPSVFLGVELAKTLFRIPPGLRWSDSDPRLEDYLNNYAVGREVRLVVSRLTRGVQNPQLMPADYRLRVKGIFKTGFYDFDQRWGLVSLETARILKEMPAGTIEFFEVKVNDPEQARDIGTRLSMWAEQSRGNPFWARSWQELNPVLLQAVKIEKVVMAAILTMVVLVAAFGICGTLVMTVLEKTREIGTLMAMGARRKSVMRVFVINGFLVGTIGVLLGLFFGLGICWMIEILKLRIPGGGEVYVLDTLPVEIRFFDIAVIVFFAALASTLAGVYPAYKASRLNPVEALGHE